MHLPGRFLARRARHSRERLSALASAVWWRQPLSSCPIPFGNLLPALALCAFGLALMERDGALVLLGLGTLAFSLIALGGAAIAVKALALEVLSALFGPN